MESYGSYIRRDASPGAVLRFCVLCAILAVYLSGHAFAAPAVPALPQREEQRGKVQITDNGEKNPLERKNIAFTLSEIRVEHEGLILSKRKISSFTDKIIHRQIRAKELNDCLEALTAYARKTGYIAAFAYVPEQTAVEGKLLIKIAPGRFGKIILENKSGLSDSIAENFLKYIKTGDIIKQRVLEDALYRMGDLSGVRARGIFSPGEKQGTSDLKVVLTGGNKNRLALYSDNFGSTSAGRYRQSLQYTFSNALGRGEMFSFGGILSSGRQKCYHLSFESPLDTHSTLGIAFYRSKYELGNRFAVLGAEGIADTFSIYGKTSLIKTYPFSANFIYRFDYRNITDELSRYGFSWEKHSYGGMLGFDGYLRRDKIGTGYELTFRGGNLVPESALSDRLSTANGTKGGFSKGNLDFFTVYNFDKNLNLSLKFSGQMAANNLDSSEHIYLGGARGVRAYPQGEASGDSGFLSTAELSYRTKIPGLALSAYFDGGHVNIAKDGCEGNMTLKGWGLGVTYSRPEDYYLRFDYARRISADELMTKEAKARGRMWFMAAKYL